MIWLTLGCTGGAVSVEVLDTAPPWVACDGLQLDVSELWAVEGERIVFDARCTSEVPVTLENAPEGAVVEDGAFRWTPEADQAGDYELLLSGPGQPLPETARVQVHVADDWDDRSNEPVDPETYQWEYGLPVVHVQADDDLSEVYVDATLWFEGVAYENRIKKRGAASLGYPKVGYTLDFPDVQLELSDRGMGDKRHLVLISTFDDNSYLRQLLSYRLWEDIADHWGIEDRLVVRTFPVVLYLNEEYRGIYIAADHVDDEFLGQMGMDRESPLYKAVNHDANFALTNSYGNAKGSLHDGYELKEGESWKPLEDAVGFTGSATFDEIVAQGDAWLRSEEFLDWWAFVVFCAAGDSAGKNSYIAYDAASGQIRFAPWDFNHSWGQDWRTLRLPAESSDLFTNRNRVFEAWMEAAPDVVWARWEELLEGPFSTEHQLARVEELYALMEPAAQRDWDRWGSEYRSYSGWSWRDDWTTFEEERAYLVEWIEDRHDWASTLAR